MTKMNKTKKTFATLTVLAVLAVGGYALFNGSSSTAQAQAEYSTQTAALGDLTAVIGATGTVRAQQTADLVWQTSGSVDQVLVAAGDVVAAGENLAVLDTTSVPQNVILAQSDLVSAQQAMEDLLSSDLQRAQALETLEAAQQALEDLYDLDLRIAQAQQAVVDAERAVEDAERSLAYLTSMAGQADIDAAKAQVLLAEQNLERAEERYEPFANKPEDNLTRANLLSSLSAAQQQYDSAVRNLNALQSTGNPVDIARAEADLTTARVNLTEAQAEQTDLLDGPSPAEIALAEARLADAQREWERIKNGPDADDIAAAQARIDAAEATLKQIDLSAPFAGEITAVELRSGDQVNAGSLGFRIDDLSSLYVDVMVSEVDINQLGLGQAVELSFDAIIGSLYRGTVVDVSSVGTDSQGVVEFKVTVQMSEPDAQVKPGMTAAVLFTVSELKDVLLVPNQAIRSVDGELVVYVLEDSQLVTKPISLGASAGSLSEVLSGDLAVGDTIVLNPPSASILAGPEDGSPIFGRN